MQNNKEKHYLIYQITNLINGKIYVGKHIAQNINDEYMGSGKLIIKAIEKYGRENFRKDILFECSSEDEMNKKEAEIVNEEFCSRDDTYNIVTGGGGGYSNVVFYANRVLNEKLKNDPEFRRRFSESCSHCFENASPEMKERYREGSRRAGLKTRGKVYLYNDGLKKCIRVHQNQVSKFLEDGWCLGRKSYTTTYMMDLSGNRHSIENQDVDERLNSGWTLCNGNSINHKHYRHVPEYKVHSFDRNNFITVHNVELKKQMRIHPDDLDAFIQHGWRRGRGFVHMRRGDERKQVYVWEMDEYLYEGWTR